MHNINNDSKKLIQINLKYQLDIKKSIKAIGNKKSSAYRSVGL